MGPGAVPPLCSLGLHASKGDENPRTPASTWAQQCPHHHHVVVVMPLPLV